VAFTQVPNSVVRDPDLDVYDKIILVLIMSCGPRSFPGYSKLMEWAGVCRERVWKSIHRLEALEFIYRFKWIGDDKIFYLTRWNLASCPSKREAVPVRYTNSMSSPNELPPVRQTNPINTNLKRTTKKREQLLTHGDSEESFGAVPAEPRSVAQIINLALRGRGIA
jgi:hypothetical protein